MVPPILLLLWSKITVDLVKKLDLVKILVPPKNFTKSGLYCSNKTVWLISAKLSFIWAHNKLALIEEETEEDYRTFQYSIEDGWKVVIGKNDNPGPSDPTWTVTRIDGGKRKLLPRVRQFYQRSKENSYQIKWNNKKTLATLHAQLVSSEMTG